jgi:hypothetical protein
MWQKECSSSKRGTEELIWHPIQCSKQKGRNKKLEKKKFKDCCIVWNESKDVD